MHVPAAHCCPGAQARPHAPQLSESVIRLLQPAGDWQHVSVIEQLAPPLQEHRLAEPDLSHVSPIAQGLLSHRQRPDAVWHEPLMDGLDRQSLVLSQAHTPLLQTNPAGQAFPHVPQCSGTVSRFDSQPSSGPLCGTTQLPHPGSQAETHNPPTHDGVCT